MNIEFLKFIEQKINEKLYSKHIFQKYRILSGGCINHSFEFITNYKSFFVKYNDAIKFPDMFRIESTGIETIYKTKTIKVPTVICFGEFDNLSFLVLEFINQRKIKSDYWADFGEKLSKLHKNTNLIYGLQYNNYIGSLNQINTPHNNFIDFFIINRLEKLVKICFESNLLDKETMKQFSKLYSKLNNLIPEEKPALIHGDLWKGNVLSDEYGEVCVIDPAINYSHREAEIAFTQLFGRFPIEFYESYDSCFPLEMNWKHRTDLFNLYPLLVHLKLFGSEYFYQVKICLTKYI